MDTTICGINKVICLAVEDEDKTKEVTISNGTNTWKKRLADGRAEFLIPSVPTPARKEYTVTLGSNEFSRKIKVGYGEMVTVFLAPGYETLQGVDMLDLDEIMSDENIEFKGASAQAVKSLGTMYTNSLLTVDPTKPNSGTVPFRFGIDAAGRYGYIKDGADTVIPFKNGSESYSYLIESFEAHADKTASSSSEVKTIDVKEACGEFYRLYGVAIDYKTLTKDDFILEVTDVGKPAASGATGGALYADYRPHEVKYSADSGILEIKEGRYRAYVLSEGVVVAKTTYMNLGIKVYLTKTINA